MTATLVGIGSLMSKPSAESSCRVLDFRAATIQGWERVFNLTSITSLKLGKSSPETGETAVLAARPKAGSSMRVSVFDVPEEDLPAFYEREQRYVIEKVAYHDDNGHEGEGLLCVQNTTANYKAIACKNDEALYHQLVGQYWDGPLWYNWTDDAPPTLPPVYPLRRYLALCRNGAAYLDVEPNFLTTTYLFDGRTLKTYLEENPDIEEATRPGVAISFAFKK